EPRAMGRTALDFTAAEGAGSQRHPRILLASRTVHAEGRSGRIAIAYLPIQPAASAKVAAVTWVEPTVSCYRRGMLDGFPARFPLRPRARTWRTILLLVVLPCFLICGAAAHRVAGISADAP